MAYFSLLQCCQFPNHVCQSGFSHLFVSWSSSNLMQLELLNSSTVWALHIYYIWIFSYSLQLELLILASARALARVSPPLHLDFRTSASARAPPLYTMAGVCLSLLQTELLISVTTGVSHLLFWSLIQVKFPNLCLSDGFLSPLQLELLISVTERATSLCYCWNSSSLLQLELDFPILSWSISWSSSSLSKLELLITVLVRALHFYYRRNSLYLLHMYLLISLTAGAPNRMVSWSFFYLPGIELLVSL